MSVVVSLKEFIGEWDLSSDEVRVYLNRRTGEFLSAPEEECDSLEEGWDEEGTAVERTEEERAFDDKIREATTSEDWLQLPSQFEMDPYEIMDRFCDTVANKTLAEDLRDTIGGRGTFSRFKNMLNRHGLIDDWYPFREEAMKRFAKQWLTDHDIPYRD